MPEKPQENRVLPIKYWRLFELVLAVVYALSVATAIMILSNPEWHEHIVRLFSRSWNVFVTQDVGSTSRGFLNASLEAIFSIFTVAVMIGYLHGFKEFKKHIAETAIIALFAFPTVAALVYGTQLAWEMAKANFVDHNSLASSNRQLTSDRDEWKRRATDVASIVCNPVREPKLALLVGAKEVANRVIEIPTSKPTLLTLQMVVKNVGEADASNVSMRVYLKSGFEPPGWFDTDWERVSSDDPEYPDEFYSTASSPMMPRTIKVGEPLSWAPLLIQPQPGVSIEELGIPVRVKIFSNTQKPVISNFRVKAKIVDNPKK